MTIRAVLFDFGGVIIDSPFAVFTDYETRAGLRAGVLREVNTANPDGNAWAQMERGQLEPDEFATLFAAEAAELGAGVDGAVILEALTSLKSTRADARPVMLDAVHRCREAGIATVLITNNMRPLRETGGAWVFDEFDAVVESCLVGARKPDPLIYDLACRAVGVTPPHAVLLDDLGINLKPARALGMHTIKVGDPAVAVADLDAVLAGHGR